MTTLPLSEVKARLSQIADEVYRTHDRVMITHNGRPYLVRMSAEDLESIEATVELLADAEAVRRVEQARQDLAAGRGTSGADGRALVGAPRGRRCLNSTPTPWSCPRSSAGLLGSPSLARQAFLVAGRVTCEEVAQKRSRLEFAGVKPHGGDGLSPLRTGAAARRDGALPASPAPTEHVLHRTGPYVAGIRVWGSQQGVQQSQSRFIRAVSSLLYRLPRPEVGVGVQPLLPVALEQRVVPPVGGHCCGDVHRHALRLSAAHTRPRLHDRAADRAVTRTRGHRRSASGRMRGSTQAGTGLDRPHP